MRKRIHRRILSVLLSVTLLCSYFGSINAESSKIATQEATSQTKQEITVSTTESATVESTTEESADSSTYDIKDYYKDGRICIYNYQQLLKIGSGDAVSQGDLQGKIGTGEDISVDGNVLTYGLDDDYYFMDDISMNISNIWNLSDKFTGSIESYKKRSDTTVYDEKTDTIYIYNKYQLNLLCSENCENETVMSEDYNAKNLGMGKVFTLDDGTQLTYGKAHNYVIVSNFSADTVMVKASTMAYQSRNNENLKNGRDYFGQVSKEIDGKTYILIGSKQQLQQIGKDTRVVGPIWKIVQNRDYGTIPWHSDDSTAELYYPGDADLTDDVVINDTGTVKNFSETPLYSSSDYSGKKIGDTVKLEEHLLVATKQELYCGSKGVDSDGKDVTDNSVPASLVWATEHTNNSNLIYDGTNLKYSEDANYIIFRDIYLTSDGTPEGTTETWDPIDNFTGTMEGRLGMEQGKNAMIHKVNIKQDSAIDQKDAKEYGVGFFRNLSTPYASNLIDIGSKITVSNITLDEVNIETSTSSISRSTSLIDLTVGGLLRLLGLAGDEKDPKSFATGALAGVVKGNVEISGCKVTNLSKIKNVNNWTGGFVGYTSGITKYSALSSALGGLITTLSTVLNALPFLGLGDLVSLLLGGNGAISVGDLIPSAYINSVITDCSVHCVGSGEVTGNNYVGGFSGESIGTIIKNSKVATSGTNTVSGNDYSGGFAGKASNAVVAGALDQLGVNLLDEFPVNTVLLNCDITGNGVMNVTSTTSQSGTGYAGGFAASLANSYAIDCDVQCLGTVKGGEYSGGFTGFASMGNLATISENNGLLALVQKLLSSVLSGSANTEILNLVGLRPSVITGASVNGKSITVTGTGKYAGGIVGYAGALQISDTKELADTQKDTSQQLSKILNKNGVSYSFGSKANTVKADTFINIKSTENAGGITGKATMTSVGDVLGSTVKAADYIRFELKDINVDGGSDGMTVTAEASDSHAGGAIGNGIGGEVKAVTLTNIKTVKAGENAGGFAGTFGSGTLANVGGVDLLGLGLLKVDGLLSVSDMIETYANDCSVSGVSSGFSIGTTADSGKSGGFIGHCISGRTNNGRVLNLKEVTASDQAGKAGGYIGYAKAGDAIATIGDKVTSGKLPNGIKLEDALGVISALTPEFHGSDVSYVSNHGNAQIKGNMAGGFIGDGEAIDVNYSKNHPKSGEGAGLKTVIKGLEKIEGQAYAGGFAGRLQPGDVAQTGSVNLLGLLSVDQLLSVMDVAYPNISNASITGSNLVVTASGKTGNLMTGDVGGYIGSGTAVTIENSDVSGVREVNGTYHAGGYIGVMKSGTAVSAGDETGALLNSVLGKILDINNLASVLQAASSKIINSKVVGINDGMMVIENCRADNKVADANGYAGGFVGEMQSGTVDNSADATDGEKGKAVENLKAVKGLRYSGGFGGLVKSGTVAEVAENSSLLGNIVGLNDLVSVIQAFVPVINNASVCSISDGFTSIVTGTDAADTTNDSNTGSAGGFIGYASGAQISKSDVDKIATSKVEEPKDLQSVDGSSYYNAQSQYSIRGYRYAGGYFGKSDLGTTASLGGANVLSKLIQLGNLVSALNVVVTTVEHSNVYGYEKGGFNVLATDSTTQKGKAGGYAGTMLGTQIQDGNVYNFAHIIGRESAGGYAGTIEPGNVANALGSVDVLSGLIQAENLLGVLRTFVPTIKNSETTCIPCGGAIRADAESGDGTKRGLAGGYVGYNYGGQIWGNNDDQWRGEAYKGTQREAAAIRIRSVYGKEYAGGYTGLMECANVADTGNLSVLGGSYKTRKSINCPAGGLCYGRKYSSLWTIAKIRYGNLE